MKRLLMFQKVLLTIGYGVKIGGKTDMRAGFPIGGEYVLYTVFAVLLTCHPINHIEHYRVLRTGKRLRLKVTIFISFFAVRQV